MPKRFLNVKYSGIRAEVDVTGMEDLSEVQAAIKANLANTLGQLDVLISIKLIVTIRGEL
jgi:hypothetical protein